LYCAYHIILIRYNLTHFIYYVTYVTYVNLFY
jgi:hypothetical protein